MTISPLTRAGSALVVAVLLLAGCSDDDGNEDGAAPEQDAAEQSQARGECEGTDLTFTIRATGETGTVSDPFAHTVVAGTLYNIYTTDYGLASDDLTSFFPEPPAGQNAVVIGINAFNVGNGGTLGPLAVGEQIEWTSTGDGETKALMVSLITSEERYTQASSPDAGGTLRITGVGDVVCGEIDYEDADKELRGVFEAPITE